MRCSGLYGEDHIKIDGRSRFGKGQRLYGTDAFLRYLMENCGGLLHGLAGTEAKCFRR